MRNNQRTRLLAVLLLVLIVQLAGASRPAAAQDSITLASVRVDIWPEYDQPSALVIYNISLASQTSLPAQMAIRIPTSAKLHAVAMQDPAGLYNLNYETEREAAWTIIQFTTPVPEIHIEYYDPLVKEGQARSFTYQWPGDYAVENLTLQVQQPINAGNMTFRPDLGTGRQGEGGLLYYSYGAGTVPAGQDFELEISYEKPDDTLTAGQFQQAQPNQPVDTATNRVSMNQFLPWLIFGMGLALIFGGVGVWYLRSVRGQAAPAASRARHASRSSTPAPAASTGNTSEGPFCHQCGKKAAAGDVFCRVCGTKLR